MIRRKTRVPASAWTHTGFYRVWARRYVHRMGVGWVQTSTIVGPAVWARDHRWCKGI
jgi:hypothetical protein